MFFVLPFRAKNPPERFPYVTIALIVINILVYAWTSQDFLHVRDSYVLDDSPSSLALSYSNMTVWRFFTSMFLHGNLLHIGSNMVFLWVFGSAVEGRLGYALYTAIYFLAGLCGGAMQTFVFGHANPHIPSLGASGAIMGVVACYGYMFTFSTIRVFYFYWFPFFPSIWFLIPRLGIADWEAWWVVAFFLLLDVIFALASPGGHDGTAHLAHYGGLLVGVAAMLILRPKRDTEHFSQMQAIRSDIKDYSLMSFNELEILMERPNDDVPLILTFCEKALMEISQRGEQKCLAAIKAHARLLADQGDPVRLATLVLKFKEMPLAVPQVFCLRLATRLEQIGNNDLALHMYNRVYEIDPSAVDSERALYRFANIMERAYFDIDQARAAYTELLRLFPNGYLAFETRKSLERLGNPSLAAPQTQWGATTPPASSQPVLPSIQQAGSATSAGEPRTRIDFLETGD